MNSGVLCRLLRMFHSCETRFWFQRKDEASPRTTLGGIADLRRRARRGQNAAGNEPELMHKGLAQTPLPQLITER